MESMNIILPKEVANMQLPDPQLRNFYADLSNRSFWIDNELNEYLLELIKYIVQWNKEDAKIEFKYTDDMVRCYSGKKCIAIQKIMLSPILSVNTLKAF